MKMKLVLVEKDETLRTQLEELLAFYNLFDIVKTFDGINEANKYICLNEVDAVFINIRTGNPRYSGDGSFLAYNLSQIKPDVLVALYSEEKLEAGMVFECCCDEYFRLPFDNRVLQRVVKRLQYLFELLQYKRLSVNRSMMIKTRNGYQLVDIDKVLFIERMDRKNKMVMVDGKEMILSGYSMNELEQILEGYNFYRCYQSFIVNLSRVSYVRADNEAKNFALIFEGYAGEVMVSRDKYTEVNMRSLRFRRRKMKSKVLSFAEYDQVDISMYKKVFKLDEKAYKKEIDFIKNKNSIWEETGEVTYGAFIVCNLESENPFFNRENLKIMVGQGFFHKKLEAMCVGLKKGTAGVLDVDGEKVTVTVRSIQQKKSPVITDEMIKDLGIEGVSNVEQYEAHLIREQKKKIAENEGYEAVQYVMDKVFEASTFDLKKADWKEMTDHEIKRLKAISREQGLNLETMTPEDFEGKMPFSSYHELFASVQNDSWDRLCGYLLGREYAEKDGVGYTMEQYRDDMEEYVKFWHETKENAEKINTYEYSEIMFYVNYYYNKVKEYVTENFFKEEK